MFAQGLIAKNLFALALTRGSAQGSSMSIGQVDPTRFTGTIINTPVIEYAYVRVSSF